MIEWLSLHRFGCSLWEVYLPMGVVAICILVLPICSDKKKTKKKKKEIRNRNIQERSKVLLKPYEKQKIWSTVDECGLFSLRRL